MRRRSIAAFTTLMVSTLVAGGLAVGSTTTALGATDPQLGPGVIVIDPTMSVSAIQQTVDRIADRQINAEMGAERYAILFKPGTYGTTAQPLNVRIGYGTEVAGLGLSPTDVTIVGHVDVYNRCFPEGDPNATNCFALNNFWRSLSNLTISVSGQQDCRSSANFWAVSQAAPMRRINVVGGNLTLMDYCQSPAYASGGFIADSRADLVINGSQQQWFTRNSQVGTWTNGVWNQVFSGVVGAPATCFPAGECGGPYSTLQNTPVSREKPYLYVDSSGRWMVRVPSAQTNSRGVTWANGPTPGISLPLSDFHILKPGDSVAKANAQLAQGKNLLLTPGVYSVSQALNVVRPGAVVLGLGLPTLSVQGGSAAVTVGDVPNVDLAGFMVDAGPVNSDVLIRVGRRHQNTPARDRAGWSDPAKPTALHDVFFRIGGAQVGKATLSLEVNSDHVILDDIWAWRADHGNPGTVGWTINTADTGVVVNGDYVSATGLFVEHYQKTEVIWNGQHGSVIFFQNELPYDPPSQAAWSRGSVKGYPALKVSDNVTSFTGLGMGSYSFFNQGQDIYAENAFEVPAALPAGSLRNMLTVFLDPSKGKGGTLHVVNGVGGSSTIENPSTAVTVTSYP